MTRILPAIFGLALGFALASAAANEAPPKKEKEENKPPPPPQSALTGAKLPHCEPGSYPAGGICKPAPPNYYAPAEARFPIPCPPGKKSAYGSRSPGQCE